MKKNMHNSAKSRKVYFLLLFVISCAPLFTLAADQSFVPLTSIPGFGSLGNTPSLPAFFNSLYKLCIGAAAVIAVLQIMRAGVAIMQSSGSVTANKEAKELISSAIIGLVLVLSPYVVFSVINPNILKLDLNVSSLEVPLNKVDTGGPSPDQTAAAVNDGSSYGPPKLIPDRNGDPGKVCADNNLYLLSGLSCPPQVSSGFACCAAKVSDQYVEAYYFEVTRKGYEKCVQPAFSSYSEEKACLQSVKDTQNLSNSTGSYTAGPKVYDHKCDLVKNSTMTRDSYSPSSSLPKCAF